MILSLFLLWIGRKSRKEKVILYFLEHTKNEVFKSIWLNLVCLFLMTVRYRRLTKKHNSLKNEMQKSIKLQAKWKGALYLSHFHLKALCCKKLKWTNSEFHVLVMLNKDKHQSWGCNDEVIVRTECIYIRMVIN